MHGPLNDKFLQMASFETKHVAVFGRFNSKKLRLIAFYFQLCRSSCCVVIMAAVYMKIYFK